MYNLILEYTKTGLEIVGVLLIIIGVVKSVVVFLKASLHKKFSVDEVVNEIRLKLSNYLVLSLEVIIGRDIIETLLSPSLNELYSLAGLIILRTLLAFFLNYEMKNAPKEKLPSMLEKAPEKA